MRSRLRFTALSLVLFAATGCKKEEAADAPAAQPSATQAQEAPAADAPPFTGTLTAAQLDKAVKQVLPHQPWDKAWAMLRSTVGEPTRVEGDLHGWYVMEGERCHFLEVTRDPALKEVGSSQHGAAEKVTGSYYEKCKGGAAGSAAGSDAGAGADSKSAREPSGGHGSGTGGGEGPGSETGAGDESGKGGGDGSGKGGGGGKGGGSGGGKAKKAKPAEPEKQGGW